MEAEAKKRPAWGRFLEARLDMIDEMIKEGRTRKYITHHLSLDPVQTRLLILTVEQQRARGER